MLRHALYKLHDPNKGFWFSKNVISRKLMVLFVFRRIQFSIAPFNRKISPILNWSFTRPYPLRFAISQLNTKLITYVKEQKINSQKIILHRPRYLSHYIADTVYAPVAVHALLLMSTVSSTIRIFRLHPHFRENIVYCPRKISKISKIWSLLFG
jgi:hypothetical protein